MPRFENFEKAVHRAKLEHQTQHLTYSLYLYLPMCWRNPTKRFRENSSIFGPIRIFLKSRVEELGLRFIGPTRRGLLYESKTFFRKKMKIANLIFCPLFDI